MRSRLLIRARHFAVGLGMGLILLATTANVCVSLAASGRTHHDLTLVPARAVAIVPGSRVWHGQPLAILRDRLQAGLDLYRGGRVRRILVSGRDDAESHET